MREYPKHILTIEQQLQAYKDAGLEISSQDEVVSALEGIGYYRLRGYCFQVYDNKRKKFLPGTKFSDILNIYNFDVELSHLLFEMASAIEISLRAHLTDALLIYKDALALMSPEYFKDKGLFWQNESTLAKEIARSSEVFIKHNYENYGGMIPIWAAVEVMSFGNLSKTIKNLKTGPGSAAEKLLSHYSYRSRKDKIIHPSLSMFATWTQAVAVLRNMCAHNSRLYNRKMSTYIQIPNIDNCAKESDHSGIYQYIIAMKYLRPNDECWEGFVARLKKLIGKYQENGNIELCRMNFPNDWAKHLSV